MGCIHAQSDLFPIIPLKDLDSVYSWDHFKQTHLSQEKYLSANVGSFHVLLGRFFSGFNFVWKQLSSVQKELQRERRGDEQNSALSSRKWHLIWLDLQNLEQIRKPLYCYLLHSYPYFLPLEHFDIETEQQYAEAFSLRSVLALGSPLFNTGRDEWRGSREHRGQESVGSPAGLKQWHHLCRTGRRWRLAARSQGPLQFACIS